MKNSTGSTTHPTRRRSMTELMAVADHLVAALGDWQYDPHLHVDVYADMAGAPQISVSLAFEDSHPQKRRFLEAVAAATGTTVGFTASTGIGSVWVSDWLNTGVAVSAVAKTGKAATA